jgi:adenylate kinase
MSKNLIFIGAPGSGKGTQSAKISQSEGYKHISTGDLLRSEIAKGSELGIKVKSVMESGQLVSDELVVDLLNANLNLDKESYIFDGYPRNIKQAQTLNDILEGHEYVAVYFKVDTEKLVHRLANRRVTSDGKNIYNLLTNPPKVEGVCDKTGEKLVQRDDDKEDVVRSRMQVFESTVDPVVNYFSDLGRLVTVDAQKSVDEVYADILGSLE